MLIAGAAADGDLDTLEHLMRRGVDPSCFDNAAIRGAAAHDKPNHGVNDDARDYDYHDDNSSH